jgi:Predicted nucleotide-binding protein containing TIR-like domain/Histidine-specific methyltransferase, SAM-dependent
MTQPKLFIGSSGESHGLAVVLQSLLDRDLSAHVWSQGAFEVNRANLENLLAAAKDYDFACFVASPDDYTDSRGTRKASPRDNVVFEFGLFLGALGRDRVFFLYPRGVDLKLPTDLSGIAFLEYKVIDKDNPAKSVLAPAAQELLTITKKLGRQASSTQRRYQPVLEHGGIDRVSGVTDAALYFSRRRFGYHQEIRQCILQRQVIPSRYFYFTEEGAEFWLRMSSDPQYRFHSDSMNLIRKAAPRFVERIHAAANRSSIDFVSLGSGDGEKDRLLIDAFVKDGANSLNYYPVDISDKLLVECVKNIAMAAYDHRGLHTKAIIGDFCNLEVLRAVYEDRPTPNVFSILGNTLGNNDESEIIGALRRSLYPGDFVVFEVNCGTSDLSSPNSFLTNPLVLEYLCLPLRIAGLDPNPAKVIVRRVSSRSVFQCAHSIESVYPSVEIEGRVITECPLAYDHRYDFDGLADEIQNQLDVEVLDKEKIGNACAYLVRKR